MDTTEILPQVDYTRCTLCGLCVEACLCGSVELGERGPVFNCPESCHSTCAATLGFFCLGEEVCPTGAITCSFEIVLESEQEVSGPPA
jgi:formate hydrogenlyase subunit 6/NADH:ubiquinone oxidoreductase subunit I